MRQIKFTPTPKPLVWRFTKMVASGNDFIIAESKEQKLKIKNLNELAKKICDRKFGVGADGLLILEKSKVAKLKMRIFNADGSEAEMCGNGARCVAFLAKSKVLKIETRAGLIVAHIIGNEVRIKLTNPRDIKLDIPIRINKRILKANFINTGVPHTVIFVEGLDKIDVVNLGRRVRFYKKFAPKGTNVDFVEIINNKSIKVRTYERGVEDETLACGTGAVASALITAYRLSLLSFWQAGLPTGQAGIAYRKINVYTRSGEVLKVYFDMLKNNFKNVWLEGKARIVCKGVYYV